jgi:hypothetical protein
MVAFLRKEIQDSVRRLDELAQAQGFLVPSHGSRLDGSVIVSAGQLT